MKANAKYGYERHRGSTPSKPNARYGYEIEPEPTAAELKANRKRLGANF